MPIYNGPFSGIISGAVNPAISVEGELFYNTTDHILYEWDATYGGWLSYQADFIYSNVGRQLLPYGSTVADLFRQVCPFAGQKGIYVDSVTLGYLLSAAANIDISVAGNRTGGAADYAITTFAGISSTPNYQNVTNNIATAYANDLTMFAFGLTKNSGAGTFYGHMAIKYRVIG